MTMTDIKIHVPVGMEPYVLAGDEQSERIRNAMILYPYIKSLTISHGRAAELLGIRKDELIGLYDKIGLPYLDQDIQEAEDRLQSRWDCI